MNNIHIKSSLFDYDVEFIRQDVSGEFKEFGESVYYVVDKNVYALYKRYFQSIEEDAIYLVDATEDNKTIDSVIELVKVWKEKEIRKNWKIICVGGGITQDLVTFASNIYLRNIDWYFFPTTLLSMCDSCIGGKCGINMGQYKNQLGVFYPPKKIFIDTKFVDTLSKQDIINGWGEILKFSLTEDSQFYDEVEKIQDYLACDNLERYIYQGLLTKKHIIEQDEFEGDLRRVLNYGHTFGHALEAYTNHATPHGTAVIWGIDVVNYIAYRENILERKDYRRVKELICNVFFKEEIEVDNPDKLFNILFTDKKVRGNTIYLALLDRISNLIIHPMILDEKLKKYFIDYLEDTHGYYNH